MDVNNERDWSQSLFRELSSKCVFKKEWACGKTDFACKDYMCPLVKSAANIAEVRANFAQQTNGGAKPKLPKR